MRMRTGLDLAIGDVIACSFYLPGGAKVSAGGEIVRLMERATGPDGSVYGVKFTKISPDVKSSIEAFVEKVARDKV
jgi:hypothetical protein